MAHSFATPASHPDELTANLENGFAEAELFT
jgi:hypothetical protein